MTKLCILLTATIKPPDADFVGRKDHSDRENDYYQAVNTYIKFGVPVTFIDNSKTISEKITTATKNISNFEYMNFQSFESSKGKGHGEKEIIDHAFANSENIKNAELIIKITGRYTIDNFKEIVTGLENTNADVLANFGRNLSWADSKIIIFKKKFYSDYFKPFLEKYLDENNKTFFEQVLARSIHQLIADGGKYSPWSVYPFYSGINGANGKPVRFNLLRKMKFRGYYRIKKWVLQQIV